MPTPPIQPQQGQPPGSKPCARCRKPINTAAKDPFHSLYCSQCAAALTAAVQRLRKPTDPPVTAPAAPNPTPVHDTPRAPVRRAHEPPPIPLAQDALLVTEDHGPGRVRTVPPPAPANAGLVPDLSVSPPDPTVKLEKRICLNCSQTVNKHEPICAFCGYDVRNGIPKKLTEQEGEAPKCRNCGYELTGLTKPICPECGTKVSLTRRSGAYAATSREVTKWAYLKPVIMLAIGLGGVFLVDLLRHPGWEWPLFRIIDLAVTIPAMMAVYIACAIAWIGFDMPLHLVALRISGAYAVANLIYTVLSFLPVPIVPMGFASIAYVWMLHEDLDMELPDAVIVAVLSFGTRAILYITLGAWIAGKLGIFL
ncbi:MAG TPA: hypothetical protein VD997_06195 [Phycisphaerales bacterium]|nr:hypothetical protein [Phycisphaerales bacterium]